MCVALDTFHIDSLGEDRSDRTSVLLYAALSFTATAVTTRKEGVTPPAYSEWFELAFGANVDVKNINSRSRSTNNVDTDYRM